MKDENKTKKQLVRELIELRQNITESLNADPERKGTRPLTNEYEIRYRTLFDRSLFCVYLHDLQGNLFDANETALKLFGYTKEELPSLNILSLIPEEQRPVALHRIEEILKTGAQKISFEYMVKRKDGQYLWLEVEGALIVKHGKPYAIQGIGRDITERKQAEEALQDSEQRFRTLFEKSVEAQLLLNHEGKVFDCNDAFLNLFAIKDKTEIMGHSPEDFAPDFQPNGRASRDMGDDILKTVLERGSAQYEWAHFKHDPSRTPVITELICTRISIAGEPMLHTAIRDITERKKSEKALKNNEKELKKRVKELEEFYDMAVGRELRMKELKEQIENLKKELEQYKKQQPCP